MLRLPLLVGDRLKRRPVVRGVALVAGEGVAELVGRGVVVVGRALGEVGLVMLVELGLEGLVDDGGWGVDLGHLHIGPADLVADGVLLVGRLLADDDLLDDPGLLGDDDLLGRLLELDRPFLEGRKISGLDRAIDGAPLDLDMLFVETRFPPRRASRSRPS